MIKNVRDNVDSVPNSLCCADFAVNRHGVAGYRCACRDRRDVPRQQDAVGGVNSGRQTAWCRRTRRHQVRIALVALADVTHCADDIRVRRATNQPRENGRLRLVVDRDQRRVDRCVYDHAAFDRRSPGRKASSRSQRESTHRCS